MDVPADERFVSSAMVECPSGQGRKIGGRVFSPRTCIQRVPPRSARLSRLESRLAARIGRPTEIDHIFIAFRGPKALNDRRQKTIVCPPSYAGGTGHETPPPVPAGGCRLTPGPHRL